MDYIEFKKCLSVIQDATSVRNKSYKNIHVSRDEIYFERESKSYEPISIRELFKVYQTCDFIDTVILRKFITGRTFSPSLAILIESGLYDSGGHRISDSGLLNQSTLKAQESESPVTDTDELPGRVTKEYPCGDRHLAFFKNRA